MKKLLIKNLLIPALFLIGISYSCNNILEQESVIFLESTDPINDERSAEAAVNGMYDGLQSARLYGSDFILANELTAGNALAAGFAIVWQELETAVIPTANFHVEDNWVAFYRVINTANSMIASVPGIQGVSAAKKDYYLGQAYFIRGMVYFDLLRQYGEFDVIGSKYGVPLTTDPILGPTSLPRSTVQQVYERIFTDLEEAERLLAYSGERVYATKAAAEAILAKANLYRGNYDAAFNYADKVIKNTTYSLLENYNNLYSSKRTAESILELQFFEQDQNGFNINLLTSPPEVVASPELLQAFEISDSRKQLFALESDGNIKCYKYGTSPNLAASNVIIVRLAEMYLIRAEVYARSNDFEKAIGDINTLRNRAGTSNLSATDFADAEQVLEAIMAEKRLEFAFENGSYWFDVARLGKLTEYRGVENFRRIYPIPNREMLADSALEQNPGYEQ